MPLPLPFLSGISDDKLFPVTNGCLPAWAALVLLPKWRYTNSLVIGTILVYSLLYTLLMANTLIEGTGLDFGDMSTLAGVRKLLSHRDVTLGAWVHYVAFDLLAAMTMVHENSSTADSRYRLPQWLMAVALVQTLLLGPSGFITFVGLKKALEFKNSRVVRKRKLPKAR